MNKIDTRSVYRQPAPVEDTEGDIPSTTTRRTRMTTPTTAVRAVGYVRLSDWRVDDKDSFPAREKALREKAHALGWDVVDVVVENDITKDGRRKGVSAFKRKRVVQPDGSVAYRVVRPGFQQVLAALGSGAANAVIAEDLDRTLRDPYDAEDLLAALQSCKGNARSLSGSLTITDGGNDGEKTIIRILTAVSNKASMDTSRRVAAARRRKAEAGEFGGGRRPYGFLADGVTPDWAEYEVVRTAARRLLQGSPLRLLALELREADVPTSSGKPWTAEMLRMILLRDRNAGIVVYQGEPIGTAPWPAILADHVHAAVTRLLRDPNRNVNPGRSPKHQGSGLYLCGRCGNGATMEVSRTARNRPRYRCRAGRHLARDVANVDRFVLDVVAARLARPDAVELFQRPGKVPGVDVAALRAESEAITRNLADMAADRVQGLLSRAEHLAASAAAKARQIRITNILTREAVSSSPVEEILRATDIRAALEDAPLSLRKLIVRAVAEVIIVPTEKRGRGFDSNGVHVELDRSKWRRNTAVSA